MEKLKPYLEILDFEFLGSSLHQWLIAALVFLLVEALVQAIVKHSKKFAGDTQDKTGAVVYIKMIVGSIGQLPLFLLAIYAASLILTLDESTDKWMSHLLTLAVFLQLGLTASTVYALVLPRMLKSSSEDPTKQTAFGLLNFVGRLIIWVLIGLLILDNAGFDVTTLIAGLGVGGIAVALAVQNLLGDLLGSLSIILDKPFEVGDFIVVGSESGTVEKIGIKTTRVRSISGEQLVFANSDLLGSRVRNFKRLYERRISFSLGVTYQTPHEKLKAIPGMIKEIIEAKDGVRFDRAHFKAYGDFSLNFETVYFVLDPEYLAYMDVQQEINLDIHKRFETEGIEFAYPTQTLFLEKASG